MTAAEVTRWAHAPAQSENVIAAGVRELALELDGERKANALLLAGMESQSELMDGLKQENRALKADLAEARRVHLVLMDRIGVLVEIVARNALWDRGLASLGNEAAELERAIAEWLATS